MINAILKGIFSLVISLVNVLLLPIDTLINTTMPSISAGLSAVADFFTWVSNLIPWGMSWFCISSSVITLFVGYMTFSLTAPLVVSTIKLAIKWYDKLKV